MRTNKLKKKNTTPSEKLQNPIRKSLKQRYYCPFMIVTSVFSNVYLSVFLYCPFMIAPSVFSNVYCHLLAHKYMNATDSLSLSLKVTPLIRPDFRCTDIVSY